ncbi:MAG: hypothetical protein V4659_12160 [Pseudomonadota bacterium]
MDNVRGFGDDRNDIDDDTGHGGEAAPSGATAAVVAGDERRMHVRAYNHWVSLLDGRAYPSIANLDPAGIADFGAHSVLIDFTGGADDAKIAFLGRALRDECAIDASITRIADVPGRSLLSRLTDHYLQIIANRAPVGFEAEFVGTRGHNTMYRGILMPFSSNGDAIDYIYGVINWKEMVDAAMQAALDAEVADALSVAPPPAATAAAWADGPGADTASQATDTVTLDARLAAAQASAQDATAAAGRSRTALYDALGRAHEFAVAAVADRDAYVTLLADAGISVQDRAPMTAVAKLVFGGNADKARLTEYAAVLTHAVRTGVAAGTLAQYLNAAEGGMKAVVAAERATRRGATPVRPPSTRRLDRKPALATVDVPVGVSAGYVLLLGRVAGGAVEIVADVTEAAPLARAMRRAA